MTLILEQWKEILDAVIPNKGDIFEQIKENLKEKYPEMYQAWKAGNFEVDYLFDVSLYTPFEKLTLLCIAACNGQFDIVNAVRKWS